MLNILRERLKETRLAHGINVRQAAYWAGVDYRTWRSYEVGEEKASARVPAKNALRCFFSRSGIEIPSEIKRYLTSSDEARTLTITTYKGGVGKSPITINIASCLTSKGYKVAIISDDTVFRCMRGEGEGPEPGSLVSKISFYDDREILFSASETRALANKVRNNVTNAPADERETCALIYSDTIETLERKLQATQNFADLKKQYDYILLDMSRNLSIIRNHAELIALVLDSSCRQSIQSAKKFIVDLKALKSRKPLPNFFGLITRCDIGGVSKELMEYLGDNAIVSEEDGNDLEVARFNENARRERILSDIKSLKAPLLSTRLTSAHEVVIDNYNSTRKFMQGYCYFHSVLDVAPTSFSAEEIRQLTDEIIDYRL